MSSIRNKLFIQVLAIILLIIALLWIANSFLLEPYYIQVKKDQMVEAKNEISENIELEDDTYEIQNYAIKLGNEINAMIIIIDPDGEELYSTHNLPGGRETPPFPDDITTLPEEKNIGEIISTENFEEDTVIDLMIEPRSNQRTLVLKALLDNDYKLLMMSPISGIENSIGIINGFLLIVGGIVLVISLFSSFFLSRSFTKVILKINKVASKMRKLDFSKSCEVKTKDEFGQLAENINKLSSSLDTALKELKVKNKALKVEIEHKKKVEEMRKLFISNVSHELKTPISLIQGYTEGLELNVAEDKTKKEFYCSVIKEETLKMYKLVKELLDLSRLETGGFKLYKTEFYINDLVERSIMKLKKELKDKEIKLNYKKAEKTLVKADLFRTEQILMNYLSNAIHHTDSKKIIEVEIENKEKTTTVKVYNTGKKIPEKELSNIWQSFYRIDKARKREENRFGVGLSIVKAICELDNKEYGVRNTKDGVEFYFQLERIEISD